MILNETLQINAHAKIADVLEPLGFHSVGGGSFYHERYGNKEYYDLSESSTDPKAIMQDILVQQLQKGREVQAGVISETLGMLIKTGGV